MEFHQNRFIHLKIKNCYNKNRVSRVLTRHEEAFQSAQQSYNYKPGTDAPGVGDKKNISTPGSTKTNIVNLY